MRLHVYRGAQLEGIFEYDKTPGLSINDTPSKHTEAVANSGSSSEVALADVPSEWLHWAASIVFPALARGAFVRWEA